MTNTRAGRLTRQPAGYRAFVPEGLPPTDLRLDTDLLALVSRADRELGRLDGAVAVVPDPDLFVMQFARREAVLSSQIEGTHASVMDVLEYEAEIGAREATVDVREVTNYLAAMRHGLERLATLPLWRRLLCEVHEVLMRGVRGGEPDKTPGEVRRSQNWIGGASPATAKFVPPPHELVGDLFADLDRFLHDDEPMPPLIKVGIAHAQFETIHPYNDGNGRLGRLLITFWLVEREILTRPLLYPSLYFKEHRDEYVDRLQAIREDGAWEAWLRFFVDAIGQVAKEARETAAQIFALRERDRARISEALGRRSANALALHDYLFRLPVTTAKQVEDIVGVSQPTASALVRDLEQFGLIEEVSGRQRRRVYVYREYLDLFPGVTSRG